MDTTTRKKLARAILELVAILLAALLGFAAGCSMTWQPDKATLEFLYPHHQVDVTFHANPRTQPARPPDQ